MKKLHKITKIPSVRHRTEAADWNCSLNATNHVHAAFPCITINNEMYKLSCPKHNSLETGNKTPLNADVTEL